MSTRDEVVYVVPSRSPMGTSVVDGRANHDGPSATALTLKFVYALKSTSTASTILIC
jgi:hypothetical protein